MTSERVVSLEGDETLRRTLGAAEDDLRDMDQSENGRIVEQRAQANAPKRSGTLRGSIYVRDMGKGAVAVKSDLIYAPVIHYGWAAHNISPQPFLTTALADSTQLVEANSQRQANRALSKVRGA